MTRRDFLKVAGLGAAGFAFHTPIKYLEKVGSALEKGGSFETENATYFPFFEEHLHRNSDQRILNVKPDYLFEEFMTKSYEALDAPPLGLLLAEGEAMGSGVDPTKETDIGKIFSPQLLQGLDVLDVKVAIEGLNIPQDLTKKSEDLNLVTTAIGGTALLASIGNALYKKYKGKDLDRGDKTGIIASSLISLWSCSDEASLIPLALSFEIDKDTSQIRKIQQLTAKVNAGISLAHPEDVLVFMRNIFVSSKMMTIAEHESRQGKEKPRIAFRIGAAHGAVCDMVMLGKDITHTFLEIYPESVLKNVIEYNTTADKTFTDRIDEFCKTVVIPVREARMMNAGKEYLTDNKLKDYLIKRLVTST